MTDPTPAPAPDLAAIIAEAREFAKNRAFRNACHCICPGDVRCDAALRCDPCPSFLALIDAASRPAPPVAEPNIGGDAIAHIDRLIDEDEAKRNAELADLRSRLSAAEARAEQAQAKRKEAFDHAFNDNARMVKLQFDLAAAVARAESLGKDLARMREKA